MSPEDQSDSKASALLPFVPAILLTLQAVHWMIVAYSLFGWLANSATGLVIYLIYLPTLMVQWHFNQNSCIITNVESKLKTGTWKIEGNPEEEAFVYSAFVKIFGRAPSAKAFDIFIRFVMAALWFVALLKLRGL
jgi:hypothetical protein